MIYRLLDFVPDPGCSATIKTPQGHMWVMSVALPFYDGLFARLGAAWAVFRGRAVAARYPVSGEFEYCLAHRGFLEHTGQGTRTAERAVVEALAFTHVRTTVEDVSI